MNRRTVLEYLETYLEQCEASWKEHLRYAGDTSDKCGSYIINGMEDQVDYCKKMLKEIKDVRKYAKENLK